MDINGLKQRILSLQVTKVDINGLKQRIFSLQVTKVDINGRKQRILSLRVIELDNLINKLNTFWGLRKELGIIRGQDEWMSILITLYNYYIKYINYPCYTQTIFNFKRLVDVMESWLHASNIPEDCRRRERAYKWYRLIFY